MPAADEAELLNIGEAQVWQRKGRGRAMLSAMLDEAHARNMRRVFLEVRHSNLAAIALYRSAGFAEIGIRRDYYRNADGGEDALVMARELTGEPNG
jgi:ribosomal-protein-alanine N-acetyltransferase